MSAQLERTQHGPTQPPPPLDKLQGRIVVVTYKLRGEAVIRLENGQIWEEMEAGSHLPLKPHDAVTVTRGALGSFWLSADKVPRQRVKRVR